MSDLHSLKKGNLSIREYVAKLKGICAILDASGSPVSVVECTAILLAGLPSEFDVVVSVASLSSTPVPFQRLVDALLDRESRQTKAMQEIAFVANLMEDSPTSILDGPAHGGRSVSWGRGRGFRPHL